MYSIAKTVTIEQQGQNWVVSVSEAGSTQQFACHSKRMAGSFASMMMRSTSKVRLAA